VGIENIKHWESSSGSLLAWLRELLKNVLSILRNSVGPALPDLIDFRVNTRMQPIDGH
jgi:hypothetical protein